VKTFGEFFDGHACAQACLEEPALVSYVDCADIPSIAKFLKNF